MQDAAVLVYGNGCPATCKVVDCIEHALFSISPKPRYSAGWDMALVVSWFSQLPAGVTDFVFVRVFGDSFTPKTIKNERTRLRKQTDDDK